MNKYKIELRWAIYFMIISLLWVMLERMLGWHDELIHKQPLLSNLFAIPAIFIYVLALLDKRKNGLNGQMTFQQGFVCGLLISAMVMVLSPLVQVLTYYIVTPHYFSNAISHAVSVGQMTQQEAEAYFNLKSFMLQGVMGAPVMGIVTTAVVAFFVKTKEATTI